jgi:hypothetical protein
MSWAIAHTTELTRHCAALKLRLADVRQFAQDFGIAPGIVAGRLQKRVYSIGI